MPIILSATINVVKKIIFRGGRGQGRCWGGRVRGGRVYRICGSSSHTSLKKINKGHIEEIRNNIFEDSKSEKFERTTSTLSGYVSKKYGGAARHAIEKCKK